MSKSQGEFHSPKKLCRALHSAKSGPICPGSRAHVTCYLPTPHPWYPSPSIQQLWRGGPRAQPSSILPPPPRVRVSSAHCSAFYQSPAWPQPSFCRTCSNNSNRQLWTNTYRKHPIATFNRDEICSWMQKKLGENQFSMRNDNWYSTGFNWAFAEPVPTTQTDSSEPIPIENIQ